MKNSLPAAAWAWLALVGVASFLNWATFTNLPSTGDAFTGFPNAMFNGVSIAANAWNSNLRFMGMSIPNWLAVVAAFGAAGAFYALNNGADLSPKLTRRLLIYAIIHVAFFGFIVWSGGRNSLGIGPLVTLFALGGLWKTIIFTPSINAIETPVI